MTMSAIVNQRPARDSGWTSSKPTEDMAVTVMNSESKSVHFSMSW